MSVDETIKYQGTLEKQCKLKTWAWKKYWFVLYNEQLCYYKEKEQDSVKLSGGRRLSSTELGEIDLGQANSIREMKNINHGFAFEINTKSRNYILAADSVEGRSQWLQLLQQAMQLGLAKRRTNSIRSIKSSCNSIDEADDGYTDIGTTAAHRLNVAMSSSSPSSPAAASVDKSRMMMPPPPPPTQAHPESTQLRHSIREEPEDADDDEDELYCDVTTSGDAHTTTVAPSATEANDDDDVYSYAQVEMRRKKLKFTTQHAVDFDPSDSAGGGVGSGGGVSGTGYSQANAVDPYSSVHERASQSSVAMSPPDPLSSTNDRQNTQTTPPASMPTRTSQDSSHLPEYSQVLPKAERAVKQRATSVRGQSTPGRESDDDYVQLRDVGRHPALHGTKSMLEFPVIPRLVHPRREYTERSHFDDIRLFLSRNRGMDEIFRDPPKVELSGNSIGKLCDFLATQDDPVIYTTHL